MIKLLNEQKEQVALLTDVTDLKVVKDLNSIEQIEFNFTASSDYRHELKCERYLRIQNFSNEYVIKEINDNGYNMQVIAICNIEDLQGNAFKQFTSLEQNINNTLLAALNGSGWTFELHCDTKKRRTLRKKITNSYDVLDDIKKLFRIEYKFDALNKKLYVYDQRGSDRGSYFMSDLNLVSLTKEGHTYDLITRIYPIGKDDLTIESVNNEKDYVENLSFKNKVIAAYWKDERYTVAESLRDDAILKLNDLSKPYVSYKAVVKDLAAINGTDIHMYDIGDTVTIVDKKTRTRETQRIVKLTVYPKDPDNNTCEIASHALTFEDLQAERDNILNLAGETIGTDGTISIDDLNGDLEIEIEDNSITGDKIRVEEISSQHIQSNSIQTHHLTANSINAEKIQANSINTDHLISGSITADKILSGSIGAGHIIAGSIEAGHLKSAIIEGHHIKGDVITGNHIQSDSIKTEHLSAGSVTAKEIAAGTITAGSGVIADGAIGSAQISELNASKITSGTIDTSRITVAGPNNNLKMSGNRLQVFTGSGSGQVERVSLGDVNGDGSKYGLLIRGADGKTVIMDENGVTNAGITNGSITNEKISENANIDGAKLNINSVVTKINGATESISGTKIDINGTNLSTKLSQQDTTITDQGKKIAANTSSITANTNAIKLKVDSQTYTTDKQNINTTLSKHTSEISAMKDSIALKVEQSDIETAKSQLQSSIDTANNNISAAQKDISTIKNNVAAINVDLNGITQRVSSTESTTTTLTQKVNTAQSTADTAKTNAATAQSTANSAKTAASTAQSTADSKAKVFTSTPTVPYKVGDLWTGGPSGDVMRCKTARSSGSYTASDWEKASKYTDDTTANAAKTAASNAQSTANTANATANANKTEIASTKSKVATIETNLDSITQRVQSTESTVTTHTTQIGAVDGKINTAVNNVQIGGRNYIKDSQKVYMKPNGTANYDLTFKICDSFWTNENRFGTVTLSFDVKPDQALAADYSSNVWFRATPWHSFPAWTYPKGTTEKKHYTLQMSLKNATTSYKTSELFVRFQPKDTIGMTFTNVKLEISTKATDWTPAPEDVENDATTKANNAQTNATNAAKNYTDGQITTVNKTITDKVAEIKLTTDSITQKVSSTESSLTTKINTAQSTADTAKTNAANAQSTANTANNTANANKTEIANTKTKVATIETNLNGITQRVSSTESTLKTTTTTANNANNAINNLTIGGRNLLKGTSKEIKQITFGGWDYYFPNNLTTWIAGEQLTGRIYLKPTNQEASCMIHVRYTDSTYKQYRGNIIKAGQEGYSTATITVPTDKTISHIQFSIRHSASSTPTDTVSYKEAKVEKGNKATDWTPAPEDIDSSISAVDSKVESTKTKVSSIETNLSGITSRVSNVETAQSTANGKVTSLESRMSTAENKITSDAIVSTVTSSTAYKNNLTGKVDKTQIISTINQTAESVKINANKVELSGYTTFSNLATSGQTIINADNLKTGTIEAVQIKACHFSGKNMIYIEDNGTLSCDGYTYLKHLFIPETHPGWAAGTIGSFSCAPNAWFDRDVHVTNEIYTRGTGVVRRQNGVYIQVDALGVQNTNNNNWLLINCYQSNHAFGVDLWYSDKNLKENIINLNQKIKTINNDVKIGLDLINSINHYSYNYKETLGLGNEHIDCGYIAQDLQSLNPSLVREVPQQDGSVLLEPRASALIPHLSKAIQEQDAKIKALEEKLIKLENSMSN